MASRSSEGEPPSRRQRVDEDGGSQGSARNAWGDGHALDDDYYYHAAAEDLPHSNGVEMNYLSQTDNPVTPIGGHAGALHGGGRGGPRLRTPKDVQDRVHGQVTIDGLLNAVMDTAAFQRLDRVKQLGGCVFVYPSATHTRKEHSIGVAHLAGEMARHLAKQQPELGIDESDILCVALAGLVHDLGHGPFSHMFEEFMHRSAAPGAPRWEHEEMSGKLLHLLVAENQIPIHLYFKCTEEEAATNLRFTVKLIEGLADTAPWPADLGRPEEKRFLFDIVSNKRSGVDVDKLDYLVRDSMAAFGSSKPPGFDIYRIIRSSRVLFRAGDPKQSEVCYQVKNALEILDVFALRSKLHRQVYQHRIACVAEAMITDIFLAANEHFRLRGADGAVLSLEEAAHDPATFIRLNDAILEAIELSYEPGLERAWALLDKLKRRQFYRQVGECVNLPCRPLCVNCNEQTAFEAKFCSACGKPTVSRKWKPHPKIPGLAQPEQVQLTGEQAKVQILNMLPERTRAQIEEADALYVHIVDIQNGKVTHKTDPHGVHWAVYDPLVHVGLYNPKGDDTIMIERPKVDKYPQIYLPAASQVRSLWCYLREEGPHGLAWREQLEAAIKQWQSEAGRHEQHGMSNVASPAVHDGGRPAPNVTPRSQVSSSAKFSRGGGSTQPLGGSAAARQPPLAPASLDGRLTDGGSSKAASSRPAHAGGGGGGGSTTRRRAGAANAVLSPIPGSGGGGGGA